MADIRLFFKTSLFTVTNFENEDIFLYFRQDKDYNKRITGSELVTNLL